MSQPVPNPKRRQIVVLSIVLVIAAICFGVTWFFTRHNADTAKVGDCVNQTGTNSLQVVKCGDAAADFKVIGRVEGKTQVQASLSACDPFKGTDSYYWHGEAGKTGFVLCLSKNG